MQLTEKIYDGTFKIIKAFKAELKFLVICKARLFLFVGLHYTYQKFKVRRSEKKMKIGLQPKMMITSLVLFQLMSRSTRLR